MADLSADSNAFIRPSPSSCTLGGVTRTTRETMLVCEAAGYDTILVETVGAGQSETKVADMVDFFLVLMLPGSGDELQGIKKGVLELADMIAINKADSGSEMRAKQAAHDYCNAMHIITPSNATWHPPVVTCSGLKNIGLDALWQKVVEHRLKLLATGELQERRRRQQIQWMWSMIEDRLMTELRNHSKVLSILSSIEDAVGDGSLTAAMGVDQILKAFGR
jgi:LAO/AO transport system kinase